MNDERVRTIVTETFCPYCGKTFAPKVDLHKEEDVCRCPHCNGEVRVYYTTRIDIWTMVKNGNYKSDMPDGVGGYEK